MTGGDSSMVEQLANQLGDGGSNPTSSLQYTVRSIPKWQTYEWLMKKHYARRIPPMTWALGLYEGQQLTGIVTFGTPLCSQLQGICGAYKVVELNRLVVNEGHLTPLSAFVATSLRLLPKPLVVVSYSDIQQGHHGYIYQATNWLYTGTGAGGTGWAVKGLEGMHHTSIEDSVGRYEDRVGGRGSLEELLKAKYGDKLYKVEEGEKHRYVFFLGSKKEKKEMRGALRWNVLPYPKGDNVRYDAGYTPPVQGLML